MIVAAGSLVLGGCVSNGPADEGATDETVDETTPISVTIPAERQTPFCAALIDLNDRIVTDTDIDAEALIVETYRSILPEVPPEIADDFLAVLTELETGVPPPTAPPVTRPDVTITTDPVTGEAIAQGPDDTTEYFFPSTTPAQRVNDYVEFACRDAANNPGPQATAPLAEEPSDDG